MTQVLTRRDFTKAMLAAAATLTSAPSFAQTKRTVRIGHTGITWPNDQIDVAIKEIASAGFYGLETFGNVLETWERRGGLGAVLEQNKLPLISGYCGFNMTDPTRRKAEMEKMLGWGGIIKKYGGKISVMGPNNVNRNSYDFKAYKNTIVESLNEVAKALDGIGLTAVLHQHTGTCVESREETYAVMESVDTRYVKFGPDIGQLTKGGSDAVKVVKDFLPIIQHMHLKDWNGVDEHFLGYCPVGQGKVNIPAILDLMEGKRIDGMVMVELDSDGRIPIPPLRTAQIAKEYLEKQGVAFRSL